MVLHLTATEKAAFPSVPVQQTFLAKAPWALSLWLVSEPNRNPATWTSLHLTQADYATMGNPAYRVGNVPQTVYAVSPPSTVVSAKTPDGLTHSLSAAELQAVASPTPVKIAPLWIKYSWDATVWQVSVWPDRSRTATAATPATYKLFKYPKTTASGLVPGSIISKNSIDSALYITTPNRVTHHLTAAEWASLGYPGYVTVTS